MNSSETRVSSNTTNQDKNFFCVFTNAFDRSMDRENSDRYNIVPVRAANTISLPSKTQSCGFKPQKKMPCVWSEFQTNNDSSQQTLVVARTSHTSRDNTLGKQKRGAREQGHDGAHHVVKPSEPCRIIRSEASVVSEQSVAKPPLKQVVRS